MENDSFVFSLIFFLYVIYTPKLPFTTTMALKGFKSPAIKAAILAVVYLIVASPITYDIVDNFPLIKGNVVGENNRPTMTGQIVHAVVFFILATLVLKYVKT